MTLFGEQSERVTLCEIRGATSVFIDAYLNDAGDLVIEGQDIGEAPKEFFGDSDYEYWLTISAAQQDRVLLVLIEKLYKGDGQVVSKLRDLLKEKGIPAKFDSYA